MNVKKLLILGCGYVGAKLAKVSVDQGVEVIGTTRSEKRAEELRVLGVDAIVVESPELLANDLLSSVDAVVDSIPLSRDGLEMHASQLKWLPIITPKLLNIQWAGYLSTTGVYGDAKGAWVDESHPCNPTSMRGGERLKAEATWLNSGLPAEVFRLAGIYGPERSIVPKLMAGGYKAVAWNPPHYSSRIHVDDIVATLMVAMTSARSGRITNLADDEPTPHADYVTELARLIGAPEPDLLTPEEGEKELSPAMLSFFMDNKRVSNRLLHRELLPKLKYSSFRDAMKGVI